MTILVEKYRPDSLENMILDEDIAAKIKELMNTEYLPNLLLYGPPGTGKTSIAKILINHFIKDQRDVVILNASSDRGIDVIRKLVIPFTKRKPFGSKFKIVFMEEIGAPSGGLTLQAQSALLNVIEESVNTDTRFIATTNFPEKLLPALRSRFIQLYIAPMEKPKILEHVKNICQKENIEFDEKTLEYIVSSLYPNMRTILQVIDLATVQKGNKKVLSHKLVADSLRNLFLLNEEELAKTFVIALWRNRKAISKNTLSLLPYYASQFTKIPIQELIKFIDVRYTEMDLLEMIVDLKRRYNVNPTVMDIIAEILKQANIEDIQL
jgi:DNA polymerase III, gamma/tau subunits